MFEAEVDILNDGRVHRFYLAQRSGPLSFAQTIEYWQQDEAFRTFFISLLSDTPFSAFRWETPAVTLDSLDRAFEFVVIDSPALARSPDEAAFSSYFTGSDTDVVVFQNLGGDATLVVPSPRGKHDSYGHLALFSRHASRAQNHALWRKVGQAMQRRVGDRPVWLNTAGDGVPWLHVRLDSRPKYYHFDPYCNFTNHC